MILQSERLAVDIADPGTVYRGPRFDWTGFVTQVTLDGAHTFCTTEAAGRAGSATWPGAGLCNEFGIFQPIGYDEVPVGGQFPKPGVGLLTRLDGRGYRFMAPYPIEPATIHVEALGPQCVRYHIKPADCHGYSFDYQKTLMLHGQTLAIQYQLENLGAKRILTQEYNHNFIALDGAALGTDYFLDLNFIPQFDREVHPLQTRGSRILWQERPAADFYSPIGGFDAATPVGWSLHHVRRGLRLDCRTDFRASGVAIWGTAHVISPEIFYPVDLLPGATCRWQRSYTFRLTSDPDQSVAPPAHPGGVGIPDAGKDRG